MRGTFPLIKMIMPIGNADWTSQGVRSHFVLLRCCMQAGRYVMSTMSNLPVDYAFP
jgi:hypothetical protein